MSRANVPSEDLYYISKWKRCYIQVSHIFSIPDCRHPVNFYGIFRAMAVYFNNFDMRFNQALCILVMASVSIICNIKRQKLDIWFDTASKTIETSKRMNSSWCQCCPSKFRAIVSNHCTLQLSMCLVKSFFSFSLCHSRIIMYTNAAAASHPQMNEFWCEKSPISTISCHN